MKFLFFLKQKTARVRIFLLLPRHVQTVKQEMFELQLLRDFAKLNFSMTVNENES